MVRITIAVLLALLIGAVAMAQQPVPPSPELVKLEREVSLKLAHVRDLGPTDIDQRAKLTEAHELDVTAERAIAAGDYRTAEDNLVKANAILARLGL